MNKLTGLKNAPKEMDALFIFKSTDLDCILKNGCAATAAGSHGALNIWKDFDDVIRCEFMVWCTTVNSAEFLGIKDAKDWYIKWGQYLTKPVPQNLEQA